jgi:hypothetical protein
LPCLRPGRSGSRTTYSARSSPARPRRNPCCRPSAALPVYRDGSCFAVCRGRDTRRRTATRETTSSPTLVYAWRVVGGSACISHGDHVLPERPRGIPGPEQIRSKLG